MMPTTMMRIMTTTRIRLTLTTAVLKLTIHITQLTIMESTIMALQTLEPAENQFFDINENAKFLPRATAKSFDGVTATLLFMSI